MNSPRAQLTLVIVLYCIVQKQHNDCKALCRGQKEKKYLTYPPRLHKVQNKGITEQLTIRLRDA